MGGNGGEYIIMMNNTIIITARSVKSENILSLATTLGLNFNYNGREHDQLYNDLILGIIKKVCDELNVVVLLSEFYQENGKVAILVKADISSITGSLQFLRKSLEAAGQKLNTTIKVQKEDLFRYMHRI